MFWTIFFAVILAFITIKVAPFVILFLVNILINIKDWIEDNIGVIFKIVIFIIAIGFSIGVIISIRDDMVSDTDQFEHGTVNIKDLNPNEYTILSEEEVKNLNLKIQEARDNGYSDKEISDYLQSKDFDLSTIDKDFYYQELE